ncbi:chaperone [Pseudozyma hubeiensis SY62]|uniref:Chaperone n=1 Tax=Pseudozyma hubeiensis (strain SY62) TaxID=1305764 RepID=R9P9A8_PSEHS|nr:chaperone [Pseudozyma hubeiensis SY62]GAC97929.1 chaperone [Pseudozyma hubeiensis SY62]
MRRFIFTLTLLLISILVLNSFPSRGSDFDGQLDHDVNPEIAEQIQEIKEAQHAVESLERYASVPPDYFSPLVGYTEEAAERARSHVASSSSRFFLRPDSRYLGAVVAYSTFSFHHPRTHRRVFAVAMLRLRKHREGGFLGEAYFPEGLMLGEKRDLWQRLNRQATFDRRDLIRHFGPLALHLP